MKLSACSLPVAAVTALMREIVDAHKSGGVVVAPSRLVAQARYLLTTTLQIEGLELANPQAGSFCIIVKEMSQTQPWRMQRYNELGFQCHTTYSSDIAAFVAAVMEGYAEPAPGSLEVLFPLWRLAS